MKTKSNAPERTRRMTIDPPDVPKTGLRAWATEDHDVIRRWAERHQAEPATGEATPSGPATASVNDGGAGVRFNFPGFARYRPIDWDEWFDNFDRHELTFVYEDDVELRAHELFESRGREPGHDRDDWFEAEHQAGKTAPGLSARYRLIKRRTQGA